MDYNIHKICRVCLEEGTALTSIYTTEFAIMPCNMMMLCAKIRVNKTDGLPDVICNNCIYRLGVAYHFKQECENSDIRLRQFLGLPSYAHVCDAETNTDFKPAINKSSNSLISDDDSDSVVQNDKTRRKRSRYVRKLPEQYKKRGPKPMPKLPHTCYDCQKSFKCAAQLQQHIRTHTGEKPFQCNFCPRNFAQKYNLQIHERTHTKEKPFQCEVCSKQFSALGNFQAHQKIHIGVRNHVCTICQRGFYSAGDLNKHMVTHTGIKNHHCDICGKSFTRHRDMRTHKERIHASLQAQHISPASDEDEDDEDVVTSVVDTVEHNVIVDPGNIVIDNFKCPDCDKEFESSGSLSVHFRTHGSSNLLNLPLAGSSHPHMHHPYHHHGPPAPPPLNSTHMHHAHHLSLNTASMQTNSGMAMMHAHMLPHPHPPPPAASHVTMMQRHPY